MGFLDSIGTLLGGFNDVKQIDSDGFDFREKRRQAELQRQQQQEQWQQENQDYSVKAGAEAAVGGMDEQDLGSMLPAQLGNEQRKAAIARMIGQSAQAKSSLAQNDAYSKSLLQSGKEAASMEREKYKGELRQKLMQEAEAIRQNQQMSPREKKTALMRIEAQSALFEQAEGGRNHRAQLGTVRPMLDESGRTTGEWYNTRPGAGGQVQIVQGPAGKRTSPPPATFVENQNQGVADEATIDFVKNILKDELIGPAAYAQYLAQTKIPGVEEPSSEQSTLYAASARLRNAGIRAITGAQMSEHEVPRLSLELPQPWDKPTVFRAKLALLEARVNILNQVRSGTMDQQEAIQRINMLAPEDFSGGGGAPPRAPRPPAGGGQPQPPVDDKYKVGDTVNTPAGRVRFKGGDWRKKANWEPVR